MWEDGRTDGELDMKNLIVVYRNFANVPRKVRAPMTLKVEVD